MQVRLRLVAQPRVCICMVRSACVFIVVIRQGYNALYTTEYACVLWRAGAPGRVEACRFTLPEGSLTVVVGQTGVGKTSLLLLLIGEAPLVKGRPAVCYYQQQVSKKCPIDAGDKRAERVAIARPPIALVTQQPWLRDATVRESIIGSDDTLPFDPER